MEQKTYPIRDALKRKGLTQEGLAHTIGTTRQTLSRYLKDYEDTGKVNHPKAQAEFDRIMAEHRLELADENQDSEKDRLKKIKETKEALLRTENENTRRYEGFLRRMMQNHPDIPMKDWDGNPVTPETLDLEKAWINPIDNMELIRALTPEEKEELDRITAADRDNLGKQVLNTRLEQSYILEDLWDATDPRGKPIINHDTFECTITAEEAEGRLYDFSCESYCLCHEGRARICVENLEIPWFEHDIEAEVYAVVEVITNEGMYIVGSVDLEESGYPGRFSGQIDDLVPGYKYTYRLGIGMKKDSDEVNRQEYTLREGYHAGSHPLK